jgi:hypothetical protein
VDLCLGLEYRINSIQAALGIEECSFGWFIFQFGLGSTVREKHFLNQSMDNRIIIWPMIVDLTTNSASYTGNRVCPLFRHFVLSSWQWSSFFHPRYTNDFPPIWFLHSLVYVAFLFDIVHSSNIWHYTYSRRM